ncbi:hypothetical protein TanjilG_09939 [Lupinus angustifolius]|uniref:Uncharacterized protein n=1 Tax=Lupinus angustifolius TaxID=3871 RepID=A0A1J7GSA3_LUPAN|nr:hypothetical protein TanjilG_09939 [Lupinus angustifolius]
MSSASMTLDNLVEVRLVFEEPEVGVTIVKLTHSDVLEEDRMQVWKCHCSREH